MPSTGLPSWHHSFNKVVKVEVKVVDTVEKVEEEDEVEVLQCCEEERKWENARRRRRRKEEENWNTLS
jgi:hypothetical protein